jgi:hypothetical protein
MLKEFISFRTDILLINLKQEVYSITQLSHY